MSENEEKPTCDLSLASPALICDCHKKLEQFGIPIYVNDENEFYSEDQNPITFERAFRIPVILEINDAIADYLRVEDNSLSAVFQHMAEVFPALRDYEDNVVSFWMLDVLIEGLCTAQSAKMSFSHQKATLLWIAYFFNFILKENPSRKQLFYHLKVLLLQKDPSDESDEIFGEDANESLPTTPDSPIITTNKSLPLPPTLYKKESSTVESVKESTNEEPTSLGYDSEEESEKVPSEPDGKKNSSNFTNVCDMKVILEILYRIFARVNVFLQIQTVFNKMPSVEEVNLPFILQTPKPVIKVEAIVQPKTEKTAKKISVCEKSCEDTIPENELYKKDYILPLEIAEEAKEYLKYSGSERSTAWRNKDEKQKK